jgi:TldD protein
VSDLLHNAEEILSRALANGGDLAEIFLEETSSSFIRMEDGRVERVITGEDAGAGIRLLCGEETLYAHTNDISVTGMLKAAEIVAGGASGESRERNYSFVPERLEMPSRIPAKDVSTQRKTALVSIADKAARSFDARVAQVTAACSDSLRHATICNSEGRFVEYIRPQTLLHVQVVAMENGVIQTGYYPVGGTLGFELFDEADPEEVALRAAREACLMLGADPAPTGRMPVVLSSEAGGTLVHEAVGHGIEADLIDKEMSKYCGRLGEMIAAPEITVIDDGTLPSRRGSSPVDDEGTPTGRNVLIENGRLVRLMTDLRTARKMGLPATGNGRRESYQHRPIPRMTNTMIAPGSADPADILSSTEQGLFVRVMGGGQVNTINGDFVFEVREGYLISHGKAETPVRGATLVGNGPEVLNMIEAIGNDIDFRIGVCGKSAQAAPVTMAQPTIRIRELTIGGTGNV